MFMGSPYVINGLRVGLLTVFICLLGERNVGLGMEGSWVDGLSGLRDRKGSLALRLWSRGGDGMLLFGLWFSWLLDMAREGNEGAF
ncbi:hypothetical protein BDY21DRAFT_357639 [Lineolata rhizophorae]|uniref:Uncharacterized protein n=1 Tax=Lineolata rhizophorae TaxID=578093 RepID=A0A6A6NNW5_9PEZI|nr:hypothetical protein BDY21DRAFT_357639 [Lineolata rhizophorae]